MCAFYGKTVQSNIYNGQLSRSSTSVFKVVHSIGGNLPSTSTIWCDTCGGESTGVYHSREAGGIIRALMEQLRTLIQHNMNSSSPSNGTRSYSETCPTTVNLEVWWLKTAFINNLTPATTIFSSCPYIEETLFNRHWSHNLTWLKVVPQKVWYSSLDPSHRVEYAATLQDHCYSTV